MAWGFRGDGVHDVEELRAGNRDLGVGSVFLKAKLVVNGLKRFKDATLPSWLPGALVRTGSPVGDHVVQCARLGSWRR